MKDLKYIHSKKALYKELFLTPLKEKVVAISVAFLSLILMSLSNMIFLLLVGPFLKALIGGYGSQSEILVADLLPGDLKSILSSYLPTSIEFSLVASYLPVALIVAAGLKSLSTYSFQLKQQTISLWVTKDIETDFLKL